MAIPVKVTKRALVGGYLAHYKCPNCGEQLRSPLSDAGKADSCPSCNAGYVVPGIEELRRVAAEKEAEARHKQELAEQRREAKRRKKDEEAAARAAAKKEAEQREAEELARWEQRQREMQQQEAEQREIEERARQQRDRGFQEQRSMALIKCRDCGRDVSTSATACPNCGCPIQGCAPARTQAPNGPTCPHCGSHSVGRVRGLQGFGEFLVCLVLLCVFLLPGVIYYIYIESVPYCSGCGRRVSPQTPR